MTSPRKNNTTQYVARWLQATRKRVSWQFLTCHSCRRGDQFCIPSSCFLLSSLAREEAPFFSAVYRLSDIGVKGGVESIILDSASAALSNGVQCMRIPASSSEKARLALQYRIFTVCMCINSLHSHVIRGHPPLAYDPI